MSRTLTVHCRDGGEKEFSLSFIVYFWKLLEKYHSFSLDSILMGQHKRRKKG